VGAREPETGHPSPVVAPRVVPANKLGILERASILSVAYSPRFINLPPMQIWPSRWTRPYIWRRSLHAVESAVLADEMMQEILGYPRHPAGRRADRATSMTSRIATALFLNLEAP